MDDKDKPADADESKKDEVEPKSPEKDGDEKEEANDEEEKKPEAKQDNKSGSEDEKEKDKEDEDEKPAVKAAEKARAPSASSASKSQSPSPKRSRFSEQGSQEPSLSRVGLRAFLDQSASERRRMMQSLGQQECADVEEFVRAVPRLELLAATSVVAEPGSELREGETAKLRVVLRRVNLCKDEAVGAVHAPFFPGASLAEVWWLVFSSPDGQSAPPLLCRRLASFVGRDLQGEFEFEVPASGKCTCLLSVMCDSYSGLDVEKRICFTAKRADAR